MADRRPEVGDLEPLFAGVRAATSLDADTVAVTVAQRLFATPPAAPPPCRYTLLERRGAGGAGIVYAAYDRELDRRVAIKLVHVRRGDGESTAARRARLLAEARSMAKLSHAHVVAVYDVGTYGPEQRAFSATSWDRDVPTDGVFIVMEFIDGMHLGEWLAAERREPDAVLAKFADAGRGLVAVHDAGLVHRDFKPSNVLVRSDGHVVLADFGLARGPGGPPASPQTPAASDAESIRVADDQPSLVSPSLVSPSPRTRTGSVLGTPLYMAPEQHAGRPADARSDQYAFCVALWSALYGGPPFDADSLEQLAEDKRQRHLRAPELDGRIPRRVHEALLRGLAPDPAERHGSMRELLVALDPNATRRRPVRIAAATLGVAGLALALHYGVDSPDPACAELSTRAAAVWNDDTATRLREGFAATAVPHAPASVDSVVALLGEHMERWDATLHEACTAAGTDEQRERRLACLARRV